ncbi:MAG TPA: hypothetical protein VFC18_01190 [Burkholderiales bacterium]|nr:hypothetical protein [Burkholderiales bacterium]
MTTRREWVARMASAGALLALQPRLALGADEPISRAIPSTGERVPIIGLGSSATFAQVARTDDIAALRAVLERLVSLGGRVFDTAPAYGAASALPTPRPRADSSRPPSGASASPRSTSCRCTTWGTCALSCRSCGNTRSRSAFATLG